MFLLVLLKDCVVGRVVVDGDKDDFVRDNFTKGYRTIHRFEIRVLNYQLLKLVYPNFQMSHLRVLR
jgi:hypothetical protein